MLALAACSSGEDTADETIVPDEAETSAPAFDPTVDSESEEGEDGRRWYYKSESQSALYGPPDSEGMLTLRCDSPDEGDKRVLFNWFAPGATAGEARILEVRSGGELFRADVEGVETELGTGAMWRATLDPAGDEAGLLLDTPDPLSIRLDDGADYEIRVPTAEQMRQVIRDCR
ncbi:MAG: hypothetical protein COW16_08325 [Sphingomonadales bacterium CG12_big_fil_rev_8_21_14_0_65_65_10]|nr:MAG: hypothetical protein COW16_08325 [Sphingomonadales bacterium CG12_big_fil_rev_8_21_14_0_65_65_10]